MILGRGDCRPLHPQHSPWHLSHCIMPSCLPACLSLQSVTLSRGSVSCTVEYTKQVLICFLDLLGTRNKVFFSLHLSSEHNMRHIHKIRHIEIKISALLVTETNARERGLGLLASGLLIHLLIHHLHERLTHSQVLVVLDTASIGVSGHLDQGRRGAPCRQADPKGKNRRLSLAPKLSC